MSRKLGKQQLRFLIKSAPRSCWTPRLLRSRQLHFTQKSVAIAGNGVFDGLHKVSEIFSRHTCGRTYSLRTPEARTSASY